MMIYVNVSICVSVFSSLLSSPVCCFFVFVFLTFNSYVDKRESKIFVILFSV